MDNSWYTYNELNFLDWLGTGTYLELGRKDRRLVLDVPSHRLALLKGYQRGMSHRVDWGKLDPDAIRQHLSQLIRSIEKSLPKGDV